MTEEKKVRAKKTNKPDMQLELLMKLSEKLDYLEGQVKERDEKLKTLEEKANAVSAAPSIDVKKYGKTDWKQYEHGREKGYHSSYYVDVHSLMRQQYYGE